MLDRGKIAVLSMFAVAVLAATFAVWFRIRGSERCLGLYGSQAAALIRTAPTVEILEVDPPGSDTIVRRIDISQAPGLINARTALVDDASFVWSAAAPPAVAGATRHVRFATAKSEVRLRFDPEHNSLEVLPGGKTAVLDQKTSDGWRQFLARYP